MEYDDRDVRDLVIQLHDVARKIEQSVGQGQLSDDVRKCADRLHTLMTRTLDDGK